MARPKSTKRPIPKDAPIPRKMIEWSKVNELCEAGCSGPEIASYLGVHPDTLYNRCRDENKMTYSVYSQYHRQKGDSKLRLAQHNLGLSDKDRGMLIWLGKQRLNQRDQPRDEYTELENQAIQLLKKINELKILDDNTQKKIE